MFNFGSKEIDRLSKEVDRLNTVVTVMMKEISALKTNKVEKSEKDMIEHYEAMNSMYNASAQQQAMNNIYNATVNKTKESVKHIPSGGITFTNSSNNDAIIMASTMADTSSNVKCGTYTTTYAGTSHPDYSSSHSHSSPPDYSSSHSHSSHSSSYDSSSSDCGSCD